MSTEAVLFALRVASALFLLTMLAGLFFVIWKDYRTTVKQVEANRRSYGRLVALMEIDGSYVTMGDTFPLMPLTTLGRAPTNTIVVNDTFASAEHASVALRNGQWWLEDRRSRNGTTLNEFPISQPTVLTDGDIIGVGNKRYRFELER